MNLNKVSLIGRLTRDPEVRSTQSGQTVTSVSLATSHNWKDQSGQKQEKTEFHNLVLWGRIGEIAGQYLIKGQEAYFDGRLQTRSYTGKDGVERRTTEIVVENMQLGSKPRGASATQPSAPANAAMPAANKPSAKPKEDDSIPTINLDDEKDDIKIEDVPF
jgi:single-strand DNA-binding protein